MVIFNSVYETMNENESQEAFGYDYVIAYDSESFYATTGDTTDFFYRLAEQIIHENYMELYYPTETQWREKTVEDFKTAAMGILNVKLK